MRFFRIFIIISCFVCILANTPHESHPLSTDSSSYQLALHNNADDNDIIDNYFGNKSYKIQHISFQADVYVDPSEFFYLTNLHIGKSIQAANIKESIFYLFQKNKFDEIIIECKQMHNFIELRFHLKGFWTFSGLKIHGIWFGSQAYIRHYLMQLGERFDHQKHKYSIEKIQKELHKEGFLNPSLSSYFSYNQKTKEITVHLTIKRGSKSVIQKTNIIVTTDNSLLNDELPLLQTSLTKRFNNRLKYSYNQARLVDQAKQIKKYLAQKGYLSVSISLQETHEDYVTITWHITIHQKKQFVFFGNHFFSYQDLFDLLMQFGRSVWLLPPTILAQELTRFYKERGFFEIQVETKDEQDRYLFIINEGKRAYIDQVVIHDAHYFNQNYLKKQCFSLIDKSYFFDQKLVKEGIEYLYQLYYNNGFLDIQIIGHDLKIQDQKEQLYTLAVFIKEGPRTLIKKISIPDFPDLINQEPFKKYAELEAAIPANISIMQTQREWLMSHFHRRGYLHVLINSEFVRLDNEYYELVWHIKPGPCIQCGKVTLLGSQTIPFDALLREFDLTQNMIWNQELIKQIFMRLKSYDLFDELQIIGGTDHIENHKKPILIKLHQDDPYELRLRAGLELEHVKRFHSIMGLSYRCGGSFFLKNPFDAFDFIRIDANAASLHREVTIRYERPWIGLLPIKLIGEGYSIHYDQPGFLKSHKNIYSLGQNGFLIGLAHKDQLVEAEITLGIEWMKTKPVDEILTINKVLQIARAIDFEVNFFNRWVPYLVNEQTLIIDCLDNKLDPHKGSFSLISVKGMFPLKSHQRRALFVKILMEQSFFFPFNSLVAALRFRAGHIFYQQFKTIMPSERFYLGGSHSLRSYDTDLVPPLGIFIDDQCHEQIVPQGGKSMINIMLELRFPFPLFPSLGVVVFHDAGALSSNSLFDCLKQTWHSGTGVGFRYFTPIGPLRFDIGFKWPRRDHEKRFYAWFLTFGQAF